MWLSVSTAKDNPKLAEYFRCSRDRLSRRDYASVAVAGITDPGYNAEAMSHPHHHHQNAQRGKRNQYFNERMFEGEMG